MHRSDLSSWQHNHVFLGAQHASNERRTWLVVALTTAMMVAEIVGGALFGSMAVLADGWHMSTHAAALAIAALAYRFARRHAADPRFSFGTGKLGELAAFTSAVVLFVIAILIGYESFQRLLQPISIAFGEATLLAVAGLAVNLASAVLLHEGRSGERGHAHAAHHRHHGHDHRHRHQQHHLHGSAAGADHNLRAAYLHVIADALTSVLAIAALLTASMFGWTWIDPAVGILGAAVIAHWAIGLMRASSAVLLDIVPDVGLAADIRLRLEHDGDRVSDLHLWRLGPGHIGTIVAIVADEPREPDFYKAKLSGIAGLSHVTIEVNGCPDHVRPLQAA